MDAHTRVSSLYCYFCTQITSSLFIILNIRTKQAEKFGRVGPKIPLSPFSEYLTFFLIYEALSLCFDSENEFFCKVFEVENGQKGKERGVIIKVKVG